MKKDNMMLQIAKTQDEILAEYEETHTEETKQSNLTQEIKDSIINCNVKLYSTQQNSQYGEKVKNKYYWVLTLNGKKLTYGADQVEKFHKVYYSFLNKNTHINSIVENYFNMLEALKRQKDSGISKDDAEVKYDVALSKDFAEIQKTMFLEPKLNMQEVKVVYEKNRKYLEVYKEDNIANPFLKINFYNSDAILDNKNNHTVKEGDISLLIKLYDSFTDGRGIEFDKDVMLPLFNNKNIFNSNKLAFVLYGKKSTGKSLFLNIIANILGKDNSAETRYAEGDLKFNSVFANKLFIYQNERDGVLSQSSIAKLKGFITSDAITLENKGQDKIANYPFHAMFGFSQEELPTELAENNGDKRFLFLEGKGNWDIDNIYNTFNNMFPAIRYYYLNHPNLNDKEISNKEKIEKYSTAKELNQFTITSIAKSVLDSFVNKLFNDSQDKIDSFKDLDLNINKSNEFYLPVNKYTLKIFSEMLTDELGSDTLNLTSKDNPFFCFDNLKNLCYNLGNDYTFSQSGKNKRTNKSYKNNIKINLKKVLDKKGLEILNNINLEETDKDNYNEEQLEETRKKKLEELENEVNNKIVKKTNLNKDIYQGLTDYLIMQKSLSKIDLEFLVKCRQNINALSFSDTEKLKELERKYV